MTAIPPLGGCEAPDHRADLVAPDHRADLVVYGDHVPTHTNSGDPFPNPFTAQATSGDSVTTTVMKEIPGLRHPRGATSWGVEAWATYVFLGNYDHQGVGVFQTIEDQRIGLYDSERKTFCQLDLDPTRSINAGVAWLSVANPTSRHTRIFYEGIAAMSSGGFPFGFVAGDLDNANPCDPVTGWVTRSKGFLPSDLNAAARAAGQPEACPDTTPADPSDDWCGFDGMAVLSHDDATNTDTVEIGNWGSNRIIIAQVDGADQLRVLKVHVLPLWQPDDNNPQTPNVCYTLEPVSRPAVDSTRPATDLRFLQAYDMICAPGNSPGCPSKAICPLAGTTCSGSCADAYCTTPLFGSYLREPALGGTCKGQPVSCSNVRINASGTTCVNLGTTSRACLEVHPNLTCTPQIDRSSSACQCPGPAKHTVQEFRFDLSTSTLEATSFLFQSAPAESMNVLAGGYSKTGDVFLSTQEHLATGSWSSRIIRYSRRSDGEHAYHDASATLASRDGKIVLPTFGRDYPLNAKGSYGYLSLPLAAIEVGRSMYLLNKDTIERDSFGFGQWTQDPYKLSFGIGTPAAALPQEVFFCTLQTIAACTQTSDCPTSSTICDHSWCKPAVVTACASDAGCPSGQVCRGGLGEGSPMNVRLGGAPASLWSSPHSGPAPGKLPRINAYLTRVPVAVDLPGVHTSQVPPALAWSFHPQCAAGRCDRLWLSGAPEGSAAGTLQYRTRDQGLWAASWSPLPTNVALAGGPAAVYTASNTELTDSTVEIYARRQSDGKLVRTQLTTAVDCSTAGRAACQWAPWQGVPGSPVTDAEPTATIASVDDTAVVFVAVKDLAGQIWVADRRAGTWSDWRGIPGLTSDASPSLVFKLDDYQVWLFARERQSGAMRYVRVDGGRSAPWTTAGGAGAALPWRTAPTAVYTGRLRLLAGSGTAPFVTYQTTFAAGGWDSWKAITSGAGTTRRPAAANVNGDLNVVTTYVTNLQEQLVK